MKRRGNRKEVTRMSSQVVRVQGFTKGSLHGIGLEAERGDVDHRNADIDKSREHLNLYFKETDHGFYGEWCDIKTALNAQGKETKKGIAFEGMVITADTKFYQEQFGWEQGKPMSDDMVRYFRESYEWAVKEIGYLGTDKNIMSAVVHVDETTPHLQLYYLPVTERWQEKVYAKDENGKVLRTDRGTPIQAKDENGKTIYRQVEDRNRPKLARSEFWRVRGGQTSYSQMQDRYHEQVGSRYGLGRGEVGSDKVHRTKNQWEQEQLKAEKERLIADVTPYRELEASARRVEISGKTVLPGFTVVKKKDLNKLEEQAKGYAINRSEILSVRERSAKLAEKERVADQREQLLNRKAAALDQQHEKIQQLYDRQLNLNKLLERTEQDRDRYIGRCRDLENENSALEAEIWSLRAEIEKVRETLEEKIETLRSRLRGAYERLTNIVKAVGMIKYDKADGYQVPDLTAKQGRLIDGIADYGSECARKEGFTDLAEDMDKNVDICPEIAVKARPPKRISHDLDRSI